MKHAIKTLAQAVLTITLLGSLALLLGGPTSIPAVIGLFTAMLLSGRGLAELGTFNK